jgi:hypothetical protein
MGKELNYPETELFRVKDTIGVPHPYCIGTKHVVHASDHFGGMLGDEVIRSLEKLRGPSCEVRGCNLPYDQHEQALLVAVNSWKSLQELESELRAYLLSIKEQCEAEGYVGFAFVQEVR